MLCYEKKNIVRTMSIKIVKDEVIKETSSIVKRALTFFINIIYL